MKSSLIFCLFLCCILFIAEINCGRNLVTLPLDKRVNPDVSEEIAMRQSNEVSLTGGSQHTSYYVTIEVGNPPQRFSPVIDTGSPALFLATQDCTDFVNGRTVSCYANPKSGYNPAASTTATRQICTDSNISCSSCEVNSNQCVWSASYGDRSNYTSLVYYDSVQFYGTGINGTTHVGAVFSEALFDQDSAGIMGFSYGSGRYSVAPAWRGAFGNAAKIFGFCGGYDSGRLSIGGIDDDLYEGPITYTYVRPDRVNSVTGEPYTYLWSVPLVGMSLGGEAINATFDSIETIVDSGTTFLYVPDSIWSQIITILRSNCSDGISSNDLPGICGDLSQSLLSGRCKSFEISYDQFNMFPTFSFTFLTQGGGSVEVLVQPRNYLLFLGSVHSDYCWYLGIAHGPLAVGSNASYIILGDTFMVNKYTIFDAENDRVGFAKGVCGGKSSTTGVWTSSEFQDISATSITPRPHGSDAFATTSVSVFVIFILALFVL